MNIFNQVWMTLLRSERLWFCQAFRGVLYEVLWIDKDMSHASGESALRYSEHEVRQRTWKLGCWWSSKSSNRGAKCIHNIYCITNNHS
jgi:hypothetical protein